MTYLTSPSWRVPLVRWEVAEKVCQYRAHDDAKSLFFRWERAEAEARDTPRRHNRRCGACWEGSWEGGGSLVGASDSVVPWGGDATCQEGNCTMVWCYLPYFRRCGVIFTAGKKRLAILASQSHGEVLPPCDCGARIASMRY